MKGFQELELSRPKHLVFFIIKGQVPLFQTFYRPHLLQINISMIIGCRGMEPNHYLNDQPIAVHPSFKSVHNKEKSLDNKTKHLIKNRQSVLWIVTAGERGIESQTASVCISIKCHDSQSLMQSRTHVLLLQLLPSGIHSLSICSYLPLTFAFDELQWQNESAEIISKISYCLAFNTN